LLVDISSRLQYSDHQAGHGRAFFETACALSVEGIVSKRIDAPYAPGNRGLWRKVKCLHREEFVVVGWTDPEGARPWLGAPACLLRSRRTPRLCRPCRRRHQAGRTTYSVL
jgi:bifunctional non-homologous end joining protein LigD